MNLMVDEGVKPILACIEMWIWLFNFYGINILVLVRQFLACVATVVATTSYARVLEITGDEIEEHNGTRCTFPNNTTLHGTGLLHCYSLKYYAGRGMFTVTGIWNLLFEFVLGVRYTLSTNTCEFVWCEVDFESPRTFELLVN